MHITVNEILQSSKKRAEGLPPHIPEVNGRGLKTAITSAEKSGRVPVIAEVKPASPTTPDRKITPGDAAEIARAYERGGACAISVLTEPHYFKGSVEHLKAVREAVNVPVLRKDFIVDPRQLGEVEADAILLIMGALGPKTREVLDVARQAGFECLVEIHTIEEAFNAKKLKAEMVGINNRDLRTLEVSLSTTEKLAPMVSNDSIIVSESGITSPEDLRRVRRAGADAVLVGTALMDEPELLEELVYAGR